MRILSVLLLPAVLVLSQCAVPRGAGGSYSEGYASSKGGYVPPPMQRADERGVWTESRPYHQGIPVLVLDGSRFTVRTGPGRGYGGTYHWRDDSIMVLEPDAGPRAPGAYTQFGRMRLAGPDRLVISGLALDPDDPGRTDFTLYRRETDPVLPGW